MITAPVWPSSEEQRGQQERQCDLSFLPPKPDGSALPTWSARSLAHSRCSFLRGKSRPAPWISVPPVDPRPDAHQQLPPSMAPTRQTGSLGQRPESSGAFCKTRGIFRNLTSQEIQVLTGVLETRGSCGPAPFSCVWEVPSPDRGFAQPHNVSCGKASAGAPGAPPGVAVGLSPRGQGGGHRRPSTGCYGDCGSVDTAGVPSRAPCWAVEGDCVQRGLPVPFCLVPS